MKIVWIQKLKLIVLMENSGKNSKFQKTRHWKMDFECESYVVFKKGIKCDQSAMWKVVVGPRGDRCG
jgi:hypothetical protein